MDLRSVVVVHETLGPLTLEKVVRSDAAHVVVRARARDGRPFDVTVGRHKGRPGHGDGGLTALCCEPGGAFRVRTLTRSLVDAAVVVRARRLAEDGPSYRVRSHGLGAWVDPALAVRRPALVTDALDGRTLSDFDREAWREEAWQIASALLAMVMVTPSGERAPHRDVHAGRVLVDPSNQLHLIDPGVELTRGAVAGEAEYDLEDRPSDEPWQDGQTVILTTLSAYPTFPPGTPGADMQAIGLMVYEGLSGERPFGGAVPAPRSYNFGLGPHGRGVVSPRITLGEVRRLREVAPGATPPMEALISSLLWAPFGHELSLGHGRPLHDWTALCHEAAESVL